MAEHRLTLKNYLNKHYPSFLVSQFKEVCRTLKQVRFYCDHVAFLCEIPCRTISPVLAPQTKISGRAGIIDSLCLLS